MHLPDQLIDFVASLRSRRRRGGGRLVAGTRPTATVVVIVVVVVLFNNGTVHIRHHAYDLGQSVRHHVYMELQLSVDVSRVAPNVVHLSIQQLRHIQVVDVYGFFLTCLSVDVVCGCQEVVVQLTLQPDQLGVDVTDFSVQCR